MPTVESGIFSTGSSSGRFRVFTGWSAVSSRPSAALYRACNPVSKPLTDVLQPFSTSSHSPSTISSISPQNGKVRLSLVTDYWTPDLSCCCRAVAPCGEHQWQRPTVALDLMGAGCGPLMAGIRPQACDSSAVAHRFLCGSRAHLQARTC